MSTTQIQQPKTASSANNMRALLDKFDTYADREALIVFTNDSKREISFNQLLASIRAIASDLNSLGLARHEPVMVIGNSSADMVAAILAIIYSGAICIPVDPQSPDDELEHMVKDSGCKKVFADEKSRERLENSSLKRN